MSYLNKLKLKLKQFKPWFIRQIKSRVIPLWLRLNEREQQLLMALGVFLILSLAYLIYTPLKQAVVYNKRILVEKKQTFLWMQKAEELLAKRSATSTSTRKTLTSAKALQVFSDQIEKTTFHQYAHQWHQSGQYGLQLNFERVPYQPFLKWLLQAEQEYEVTIQSFIVDATDETGLVKLQLMMILKN